MSVTQVNLIQMSFYGAIMILAIIFVRAFAINKLPKKVFVLLWKVVLLRLLIPFSIPSMLSAYSFVRKNRPIQNALAEIPTATVISQVTEGQLNTNVGVVPSVQNDISAVSVWSVLWIAGMILCAVYFAVSYLCCLFEFRTSLPVRNEFAAQWMEEHRLRRSIQIRQSDRISAPLTYGILKPVILMPQKTDWENRQQLQYIFLHEFVHICRFDMLWKMIAALALCIHWFNPLVWIMYLLFNRDIELSCDESVVRQFGRNAKAAYARTLITMEEKKSGLTPLCNNFSKNAIEERITAIMKIKKITIGTFIISAAVILAIVILFATSGDKEAVSDKAGQGMNGEEMETEGNPAESMAVSEFQVLDTVLETAIQWVAQKYADRQGEGYCDWRIESLAHAYTYEDLEGMTLQIYRMNYEFLADDPEKVSLVGGMMMDQDGWVVPEYANSTYFVFKQEGEALSYLTLLIENDCFPGDEIFTHDLKQRLETEFNFEESMIDKNTSGAASPMDNRANTMMIQCVLEGMLEEMPASLYVGDGFSIYIPDEDWQIYDEDLEAPMQMKADRSLEVSVWVEHYNEQASEVEAHLLSDGYSYDGDGSKMQKLDRTLLLEARIVGLENDTWVIGSMYPADYEWGGRLDAIAGTFAITVNADGNFSGIEQEAEWLQSSEESVLRHIMVSFYTAYFAGNTDEMQQYLAESFDGEIESYENASAAGEIEIREIKGLHNVTNNEGDECVLSLEFRAPGEDTLTYLTVAFIKENAGWKISFYGLEK